MTRKVKTLDKIGAVLKDKRMELGFSLEEMSVKTKLSTVQLKAIEDGNISFFKEDLSYLTYFVRYYANSLNLNYDDLRSDLDEKILEFTDAISVSRIKEAENINTSIMEKVRIKNSANLKKKRKKFDLTGVLLVFFVGVVVLALTYIFFTKILPEIGNSNNNPIVTNPKPQEPNEVEKPPVTSKPEVPEVKPLTVTMENPTTYLVKGWENTEKAEFTVKFNANAWVRFSVNDIVLDNPASKTYAPGTEAIIIVNPKTDSTVKMQIGYMQSNEFLLDGVPVELDQNVANTTGAQTLLFKFVGGN